MKSIAVICNNDTVRAHIRSAFDVDDSIVYIDIASMGSTAMLRDTRISAAVLHMDSFKINKIVLLNQLLSINSNLNILALSDIPDFVEAKLLVAKGAKGYANSRISIEALKYAVVSIELGNIWLPPTFVLELIKKVKQAPSENHDVVDRLSKKEFEVASLVAEGHSNLSIAAAMDISERTVKAHLTAIFDKLNIKDRLSLALLIKNI